MSPLATQAVTYYIDAEDGDDSNSGLSEGDAFQTISKVNTITPSLNPGDEVLFKRGQTFTNTDGISLTKSGTAGNPITVGSYGDGDYPILNTNGKSVNIGSSTIPIAVSYLTIEKLDLRSSNDYVVGNGNNTLSVSYLTLENLKLTSINADIIYLSAEPSNIIVRDIEALKTNTGFGYTFSFLSNSGAAMNAITLERISVETGSGVFYFSTSTNNLILKDININIHTANNYGSFESSSNGALENAQITNFSVTGGRGLSLFRPKNTILENISVDNTGGSSSFLPRGIQIYNAENLTIKNATTTNLYSGIEIVTPTKHNINIEGLYSANNTFGLRSYVSSTSSIAVSNSTFKNNSDSGIKVENDNQTLTLDNLVIEGNGTGLNVNGSSTVVMTNSHISGSSYSILNSGNLNVYRNIFSFGSTGVVFGGNATGTIAHNTLYGSSLIEGTGIRVFQTAYATIQNNLIANTGSGICLDTDTGADLTESHNLIEKSQPFGLCGVNSRNYDYSTITGLDPLLNPDFSLQSGSPAIDAGLVLVGHTADFLGNPILGLPDIGAFEWQGEEESGGSGGGNGSFVIKQSIYNEIALSIGSSLVLSPSLPGVTGGVSSGDLPFNIKTNNPLGYQVDLKFSEAVPFRHLFSPSFYILNYVPVATGVPDYNLVTPTKSHGFAYSVYSDNATQLFRHSGSTCGVGSDNTLGKCWFNRVDASVPTTIIERSGATGAEGATSSLQFRVVVDQNATPMLLEGEYQATVTVTVLPL